MSIQPMTLAEIEADPIAVIKRIRADDPFLQWGGIYALWFERRRQGREAADAQLAKFREEMTGEWCVRQMLDASRYIARFPAIKSLNRNRSTYGWKHVVERYNKMTRPGQDYYVGEGMFITAAIALGLPVRRVEGSRTFVGLSEKARIEAHWGEHI